MKPTRFEHLKKACAEVLDDEQYDELIDRYAELRNE